MPPTKQTEKPLSELSKSLSAKGRDVKTPVEGRRPGEPPWKGPEDDGPQGGITFSLLSRFLSCRERFRCLVREGLVASDGFNHRIEYGSMWHKCEEILAQFPEECGIAAANYDQKPPWREPLIHYCKALVQKYPTQRDQILKWFNVCMAQFPVYVNYWRDHQDVVDREPLLQEYAFQIPYRLPTSGRLVYLRGKWDSVDLIGKGKQRAVYLQENKTKGEVDELVLQRQLKFDLQTMLYLVALTESMTLNELARANDLDYLPAVKGVRYNVIRRPVSGGKGTIVQKKGSKNVAPETEAAYYARLRRVIDGTEDETGEWGPANYFMRWKVDVTPQDLERFKTKCLNPLLETLCVWYDVVVREKVVAVNAFTLRDMMHWQHPFGVYNILDEGGSSDLDEYLLTGSEVGLTRTEDLFPELA